MAELKWIETARKDIGIAELKSGNNPKIIQMWKDGFNAIGQGSRFEKESVWHSQKTSWCITGDMELLTDKGFMRFDELQHLKDTGIKVAYVQTDNHTIAYTDEFAFITKYNNDHIMVSERYGISCDETHKFYGKTSYVPKYKTIPFNEISKSGISVPLICNGDDEYPITDDEIMVMAGFLSDGYYNPERDKKQFFFNIERLRRDYLTEYKLMRDDFVHGLSKRQSQLFIDTYGHIQNNVRGKTTLVLFTSDERLAKQLNVIATNAGYKSRHFKVKQVSPNTKIEYLYHVYVNRDEKKKHRQIKPSYFEKVPFDGELYCVTVPSGVFVIRTKKGIIMPIGNCGGFVAHVLSKHEDLKHHIPKSFPMARSWENVGTKLKKPAYGSIAVFARGNTGTQGHVGFVVGQDSKGNLLILGGNQGDKVCITPISKARLLCCVWCGTQALPNESRYNLTTINHNMKTSTNEA